MTVDATTMLSVKERLAPMTVIKIDEWMNQGTNQGTNNETYEWKGQLNTTTSKQNQRCYINRYNKNHLGYNHEQTSDISDCPTLHYHISPCRN